MLIENYAADDDIYEHCNKETYGSIYSHISLFYHIFSSTIRSIMRAITVTLSSASALQILVKVFDQPRFKPYNSTLDAYITLKLYHNHSTLLVNKET